MSLHNAMRRVIAIRGHEDHFGLGLNLTEALINLEAADVRQADIGQDGVISAQSRHSHGFLGIAGSLNHAAETPENAMSGTADAIVVIRDQDAQAF